MAPPNRLLHNSPPTPSTLQYFILGTTISISLVIVLLLIRRYTEQPSYPPEHSVEYDCHIGEKDPKSSAPFPFNERGPPPYSVLAEPNNKRLSVQHPSLQIHFLPDFPPLEDGHPEPSPQPPPEYQYHDKTTYQKHVPVPKNAEMQHRPSSLPPYALPTITESEEDDQAANSRHANPRLQVETVQIFHGIKAGKSQKLRRKVLEYG